MAKEQISRRTFLKNTSAVVTAAALAGNLAQPRPAAAQSTGRLQFGVQTPPQHVPYSQVQDVWLEADELGYDSAFGFDHFLPILSDPTGPWFGRLDLARGACRSDEAVENRPARHWQHVS